MNHTLGYDLNLAIVIVKCGQIFEKKKDIGFQKIKKCTQIEMLLKEKKFQKLIEKNMVPGNMTVTKANVSHRRNITYSTKNIIYLYNVLKTFGRFQENNSG